MKNKTFNRIIKKIHEINNSPIGESFTFKKLVSLDIQQNYNPLLNEWYGDKKWETIASVKGILEAFKESEVWRENGMLSIHDYKLSINNDINVDTNCICIRDNDGVEFEIIFKREFIGEFIIGLRPKVINNANI
jgi:hypothetical protein